MNPTTTLNDPTTLVLFAEALAPTNARTEYDDRYDAARLEGCPEGLIALVAGNKDQFNVATACDAILSLFGAGFEAKEVCKAADISLTRLATILKFVALPAVLQDAIRQGQIANGVALRLLHLTRAEQERAAAEWTANGKLSGKHLDELRQVAKATAILELPATLFAPTQPATFVDRLALLIQDHAQMGAPPDEVEADFRTAMARCYEVI